MNPQIKVGTSIFKWFRSKGCRRRQFTKEPLDIIFYRLIVYTFTFINLLINYLTN